MLLSKPGFLEGLRRVGGVKVERMRVLQAVKMSALKELSSRGGSARLWPRLSLEDLLVLWTYRLSVPKKI